MARKNNSTSNGIDSDFTRRVLFVAVVAVLTLLAWQLLDLFLLVFGAIIVATALRALAGTLEDRLHVPSGWSVLVGLLVVVAALIGFGWWVGDPLAEQLVRLRQRIPDAWNAALAWVTSHRAGSVLLELWESAKDIKVPWGRLAGIATGTMGMLGAALLILFMGIFLAVDPRLYRDGFLRLLPTSSRERTAEALRAAGQGLSRWLLGQAISMLFVGSATALGLWLLGIPLALSLGVLCGLLAFVPFFGAITGGVLAVLLAFVEGPSAALYVLILFIGIQQVEGHLLVPFVQKWAVDLPPALGLVATVAFAIIFGLPGALLATPLIVVVMILVRKLYVEDSLEER